MALSPDAAVTHDTYSATHRATYGGVHGKVSTDTATRDTVSYATYAAAHDATHAAADRAVGFATYDALESTQREPWR